MLRFSNHQNSYSYITEHHIIIFEIRTELIKNDFIDKIEVQVQVEQDKFYK